MHHHKPLPLTTLLLLLLFTTLTLTEPLPTLTFAGSKAAGEFSPSTTFDSHSPSSTTAAPSFKLNLAPENTYEPPFPTLGAERGKPTSVSSGGGPGPDDSSGDSGEARGSSSVGSEGEREEDGSWRQRLRSWLVPETKEGGEAGLSAANGGEEEEEEEGEEEESEVEGERE